MADQPAQPAQADQDPSNLHDLAVDAQTDIQKLATGLAHAGASPQAVSTLTHISELLAGISKQLAAAPLPGGGPPGAPQPGGPQGAPPPGPQGPPGAPQGGPPPAAPQQEAAQHSIHSAAHSLHAAMIQAAQERAGAAAQPPPR